MLQIYSLSPSTFMHYNKEQVTRFNSIVTFSLIIVNITSNQIPFAVCKMKMR